MKKRLMTIIFAVMLLFGQVMYIPGSEYLIGAEDDTIELYLIESATYEV